MNNFILFHTVNLSNFIVNIYSLGSSTYVVDADTINGLTDILNTKQYPREIVETLESLNGIAKIEVLDYDNNLLLNSELFL